MIRSGGWTSQPWLQVPLDIGNPNSIGFGLKAAWLMNAGGGSIYNRAQNNYPGTLSGSPVPTYGGSPYGNALLFDATNGYVADVATAQQLDFMVSKAVFSVAFRMRLTDNTALIVGTIIGGNLASAAKAVTIAWENRAVVSSPKAFRMLVARNVSGTANLTINYQSANNTIVDNLWHHVAITANATSAICYVDGVPSTPTANTSGGAPSGPWSTAIYIGALSSASGIFGGQIEHLYIWDRVLSADEVIGLCDDPYQVFASPVPAYLFGSAAPARSLFFPATLSLGSGGSYYQSPVNG